MTSDPRGSGRGDTRGYSRHLGSIRPISVLLFSLLTLTQVPVASAGHGAAQTTRLTQGHGVVLFLGGFVVLGGAIILKRLDHVSPTTALYGVFGGLVGTALGGTLFSAASPQALYSANSIPFPRSWYPLLALSIGLLITVLSFTIGRLRWPTRPRYTFLGLLMGLWIAYPYLIPGTAAITHPLGYAIVLGTPVLVGYVIWKDAGGVLREVLRDPVARRFGIGVGIVVALFFTSVTGYFSFFPEPGLPNPNERSIVVLSAIYQLVTWPILEIYLPRVPLFHSFFIAVSPGQLIITGLLSTLVGLHAALIARHWRVKERVGMTGSSAGSAAVVGSCTCCCCGPLVAKVVALVAGPSITAPVYWVFVDSASPLSTLFIVTSIVLFTGSIVYSVESAPQPDQSTSTVPAD